MAGVTPTYGWPYPTGTDKVVDGDNAIEALARAIETRLVTVDNKYTIAANSVFFGDSAVPFQDVLFPPGRFIAPPTVTLGVIAGSIAPMIAFVGNVTKDGCTIYVDSWKPWVSGAFSVYWQAMAHN